MGNTRSLALSIANALFLVSLGLAFVPAAAAHECDGGTGDCGECTEGEYHDHYEDRWWPDEDFSCQTQEEPDAPACDDGEDNDGDGKVDMADPGCYGRRDDNERDPPPPGEESFCEEYNIPQIVCDVKDWLLGDGGPNPLTQLEIPN